MARRLLLLFLVLLIPTFAFAETSVFHILTPGWAPFETVETTEGNMFAEDTECLSVDFIDYGASDCILLRCGGEVMLVDGAVFKQFRHLENVFNAFGLNHFDYLVNTHAHDDHIQGLISILIRDYYTVGEYMSCYPDDYNGSKYNTRVRQLLTERNIPYRQIGDGDQIMLGGASVTVFRNETPGIDKNSHSIVLKVVFGECSVLLTADVGAHTQDYLLERYGADIFKADVLKFPHHGYSYMRTAFLDAVQPAVCVITNCQAVAEKADKQLARRGIPRYYTNMGVVLMQTDGHIWQVEQKPWGWPGTGS